MGLLGVTSIYLCLAVLKRLLPLESHRLGRYGVFLGIWCVVVAIIARYSGCFTTVADGERRKMGGFFKVFR